MLDFLLRKHLWAIDLTVVAVCAIFCGMTVAGLVATGPWSPPPPVGGRPPSGAGVRLDSFDKRPDGIIARNIFCSDCRSHLAMADADELLPDSTSILPLALLAVMYAPTSRLGNLSVAVLRNTDSRLTGAFALGDQILGATISDIQATRIYLDREGAREYLDLLPPATARVAQTSAGAPRASAAVASELERGIKKLGEHRYEVERRTLDAVLENVGLLSRSVRPVPALADGKMTGFRLLGVHADGPLAKVGIENGDVLSSINGLELSSPDKVIEAFHRLRSASHFSLALARGHRRITNDYAVR
jgi:general secretion pathway protein C